MEQRNSSLELSRIISMIFITFNHIASLGQTITGTSFNGNTVLSCLYLCGGKFGTNVFAIISVYFLTSANFKFIRIFRIWCQTLFYSIFLNIIDALFLGVDLSTGYWIKSFFPVIGRNYWYSSAYILLLLAIPVLNQLYERWKIGKWHILVALIVFSIIPTVTFNGGGISDNKIIFYLFKILSFGPVWFCVLYIFFKYLKNNSCMLNIKRGTWIVIFGISYVLMFFIVTGLYFYGQTQFPMHTFFGKYFSTIRDMTSVLCLTAAVAFFMIFLKTKIEYNKHINKISSFVFGVYLFQCHPASVSLIWSGIFPLKEYTENRYFIVYSVLLVAIIFCLSFLVESLYKAFLKKFCEWKFVKIFINFMQSKLEKIYTKIPFGS